MISGLVIGFLAGIAWRRMFVAPLLRGHHEPRLVIAQQRLCERSQGRPMTLGRVNMMCAERDPNCSVTYHHDHFPG